MQVMCDTFTGAVRQDIGFVEMTEMGEHFFCFRITFIKKAGVVQMFVDPVLDVFEFAKIDDKAIGIHFAAGKGQRDVPIVTMNERAMSVVLVLPMGKGYVTIRFFAGEHFLEKRKIRRLKGWKIDVS